MNELEREMSNLQILAKHLAGKHPQKSHGGGRGSAGSGTMSLADKVKANGGTVAKFRVPRDKIRVGSGFNLPDGSAVVQGKTSKNGNVAVKRYSKSGMLMGKKTLTPKSTSWEVNVHVEHAKSVDEYGNVNWG